MAIVDFRRDSEIGPPPRARISADHVKRELAAAGYALAAEHEFLPNQYFLVFRPQQLTDWASGSPPKVFSWRVWHWMQRCADGVAFRRSKPMSPPQSVQVPYSPPAMRSRAVEAAELVEVAAHVGLLEVGEQRRDGLVARIGRRARVLGIGLLAGARARPRAARRGARFFAGR